MKPIAIYNVIASGSVIFAIFLWYLLLGLFEHRIGTPVILRPGEEPFAYDTGVMPFVPCCGLLGYLLFANVVFAVVLSHAEPLKKVWWITAGLVFLSPFLIPLLVVISAVFFPYQSEPIIIRPDGS